MPNLYVQRGLIGLGHVLRVMQHLGSRWPHRVRPDIIHPVQQKRLGPSLAQTESWHLLPTRQKGSLVTHAVARVMLSTSRVHELCKCPSAQSPLSLNSANVLDPVTQKINRLPASPASHPFQISIKTTNTFVDVSAYTLEHFQYSQTLLSCQES